MIASVSNLLAIGTIVGDILFVAAIIVFFAERKGVSSIGRFMNKYSLWLAFFFALVAMSGSLFYSQIAHYQPCELCWFQRICMYPQVLILLIAAIKKERSIFIYSILLSVIGSAISIYHILLQFGWNPLDLSCGAIGQSESCSKLFVLQYGYVTIPTMALTSFLLIIASLLFMKLPKDQVQN